MSSIIFNAASDDAALTAYIDAAGPILGLTIAPDWQADVLFHLKAIAVAATLVQAYPLDEAMEPAPLFQA
jgi:hypothetical protein